MHGIKRWKTLYHPRFHSGSQSFNKHCYLWLPCCSKYSELLAAQGCLETAMGYLMASSDQVGLEASLDDQSVREVTRTEKTITQDEFS